MIKRILKKSPVYLFWKEYLEIRDYWRWLKNGKPVPPPHTVKQSIIKEYAKHFNCPIFFETGTYKGDMIDAVKHDFEQIYSMELSESLYQQARQRFKNEHHIILLKGDSGKLLPETLKKITKPCLFWLDAHYSGENTAKSEKNSPIMNEIIPILNHGLKNHVILLDDARLFIGKDGYPDIVEFRHKVIHFRKDLDMLVETDIIRIFQREKRYAHRWNSR